MRPKSPRISFALSLAALLVLPTLAGARAQSSAQKQSGEWKSFRGTVGAYKVQMRLRRDGDALSGTYFYERVRGGGLRLEGND